LANAAVGASDAVVYILLELDVQVLKMIRRVSLLNHGIIPMLPVIHWITGIK